MRVNRRGWRYFATRLNGDGTEDLLDPDIPLDDVEVTDALSGACSLSGTLEPVYARLLAPDGKPLFNEWSTAIYAENDGDIRGGGIMTHSDFDGPSWEVECVGFTGYGRDMPYTGSGYKGIRVDPMDAARVIWDHIQSQSGGDIGLEFDDTTTGGKVSIGTELKQVEFDTQSGPISFESGPYRLNWYTNHDLQGDFDDLAEFTPFDYREKHTWREDGTIRHFVEMGYPKLGRRRTDLRFVHGVNVLPAVTIERDGEMYASGTMVLGAGEGAAMIRAIREPVVPESERRLRRIAVVTDDTIKSKNRAIARAELENQWRRRLDDFDTIVVTDHPNAPLGSCQVGDEIRIEGQGDWLGVDTWTRVISISWAPDRPTAEYTVARSDKLTS